MAARTQKVAPATSTGGVTPADDPRGPVGLHQRPMDGIASQCICPMDKIGPRGGESASSRSRCGTWVIWNARAIVVQWSPTSRVDGHGLAVSPTIVVLACGQPDRRVGSVRAELAASGPIGSPTANWSARGAYGPQGSTCPRANRGRACPTRHRLAVSLARSTGLPRSGRLPKIFQQGQELLARRLRPRALDVAAPA
jgi:hypothetical protein